MSFTYGDDPENSPLDWVRMKIGDTDGDDQLLSDAVILYELTAKAPYFAAAACAQMIAGRFARLVTKSVGKLSIQMSTMSTQYMNLAAAIRREGAMSGIAPYALATSRSAKQAAAENSDRILPDFTRRTMDYPGMTIERGGDGGRSGRGDLNVEGNDESDSLEDT